MKIETLVGEHVLTAVDVGTHLVPRPWGHAGEGDTVAFVLDGKGYLAAEDPSDGYRSYMNETRAEGQ